MRNYLLGSLVAHVAVLCLALSAPGCESCGMSSAGNELTGQVKKVVRRTPIMCGDYYEADVSLGVLRNGVGSFSHEDKVLTVADEKYVDTLRKAAEDGSIVKVYYDTRRIALCIPDDILTGVVVLGSGSGQ